jgi:hypothetical protein
MYQLHAFPVNSGQKKREKARTAARSRQRFHAMGVPAKPNAESGMNPNGIPG